MSTKIKYTNEPLGEIKIARDFLPSGKHTKQTTVFFDPAENAEDLAACAERANEPLVSYDDVLKELKVNGCSRSRT